MSTRRRQAEGGGCTIAGFSAATSRGVRCTDKGLVPPAALIAQPRRSQGLARREGDAAGHPRERAPLGAEGLAWSAVI